MTSHNPTMNTERIESALADHKTLNDHYFNRGLYKSRYIVEPIGYPLKVMLDPGEFKFTKDERLSKISTGLERLQQLRNVADLDSVGTERKEVLESAMNRIESTLKDALTVVRQESEPE